MNPAIETKDSDAVGLEERAASGTFAPGNKGGPGRPSAKIKALKEHYAEFSGQEAIKRLAADVGSLTAKLAALDADYQKKEDAFVESAKPLLKEREEVVSLLARALAVTLDRPPGPGFITALREALGLTQKEFGEQLGVDKMTVSRWERGALKPSDESLATLDDLRRRAVRRGVTIPA